MTRWHTTPVAHPGAREYRTAGAWRVYLSPGEDATGHVHTVRHEVAHVLSWCTGRGLDYGHSHADVWGAQGVVWRRGDGR